VKQAALAGECQRIRVRAAIHPAAQGEVEPFSFFKGKMAMPSAAFRLAAPGCKPVHMRQGLHVSGGKTRSEGLKTEASFVIKYDAESGEASDSRH
jgi:hypothetical protein